MVYHPHPHFCWMCRFGPRQVLVAYAAWRSLGSIRECCSGRQLAVFDRSVERSALGLFLVGSNARARCRCVGGAGMIREFWQERGVNSAWDIWFNAIGYRLGEYLLARVGVQVWESSNSQHDILVCLVFGVACCRLCRNSVAFCFTLDLWSPFSLQQLACTQH